MYQHSTRVNTKTIHKKQSSEFSHREQRGRVRVTRVTSNLGKGIWIGVDGRKGPVLHSSLIQK